MKKSNKSIVYSIVVLVCTIMLLGSLTTVSAISQNRVIDTEGPPRESKHPAVDAIFDDVYTTYTAEDLSFAPPPWGIFLSMNNGVGNIGNWAQIGWVDSRPGGQAENEQDFSDVFIQVSTNRVHIVWQEHLQLGAAEWVIMYRYYDPGVGWGPAPIQLSTNADTGRDALYPKVACDGYDEDDRLFVHVVWQEDQPDGVWEVMYIDSLDDGVTWPNPPAQVSGGDGTQSIHPVIEVDWDFRNNIERVDIAWESVRAPNKIWLHLSNRIPGAPPPNPPLALRWQGLIDNRRPQRAQTHPDICAKLYEYHVTWVEDIAGADPRLGNVWVAHDGTGLDAIPPLPANIFMLTVAGVHPCSNLVDRFSWGPAIDLDDNADPDGQGPHRIAVAMTAYDNNFDPANPGMQNTELFCDIADGAGVNYVWNVPTATFLVPTLNHYEHYPDVAVEPYNGPDPPAATNTYAHIVYDRCILPPAAPYWEAWYGREP